MANVKSEFSPEWYPSGRVESGEYMPESAEVNQLHLRIYSTKPGGPKGTWVPRVNGEMIPASGGGVLCCETADQAKAEATLEVRRRLAFQEFRFVPRERDQLEAELSRLREAFRYMARRDPDPTCWRGYSSPLGPEAREFAEEILAGKSLSEIVP